MKTSVRHQCFRLLAQRIVAIGIVAAVLMLAVLAASPELHQLIHADAGHADHECAVTLFQHGVETASASLAAVAVMPILIGRAIAVPEALYLRASRHLLRLGRAPPVA